MRDVGRWVGDEGRRIGCQWRRGSDLKPEKTLLLLDLLPGDEPGEGEATSETQLVQGWCRFLKRTVTLSLFYFPLLLFSVAKMYLFSWWKSRLRNISKVVTVIKVKLSPKSNRGFICGCIWVKLSCKSVTITKEALLRFTIVSFSGKLMFN